MTKASEVFWKEDLEEAGRLLPDALIQQNYVPNESGQETRERVLEQMGEPFGLRWDTSTSKWVAR